MTDPETLTAQMRELETAMRDACPKWDYDQHDERDVLWWADQLAALTVQVERLEQENFRLRDVLTWTETNCPERCGQRITESMAALRGSDR